MHKPPYNIRLKDDKRYPYLKLTLQEEFPALLEVRAPSNDKATYFGPYAGAGKMRQTVSLAKRVFKVRTGAIIGGARRGGCPWRDTSQLLDKPCLEYHINRCTAPCVAAVSPENYAFQARELKDFLGRARRRCFEIIAKRDERSGGEHGIRAGRDLPRYHRGGAIGVGKTASRFRRATKSSTPSVCKSKRASRRSRL